MTLVVAWKVLATLAVLLFFSGWVLAGFGIHRKGAFFDLGMTVASGGVAIGLFCAIAVALATIWGVI